MSIRLKNKKEIEILAEGGKILADVLAGLKKLVRSGVSTLFLNEAAKKLIKNAGAEPIFENYKTSWADKVYGFALCVSLNEVVVHGKPSSKIILKDGDIISLDLGIRYKGLITDSAITVGIGKVSSQARKLIRTTEEALYLGIKKAKIGNKISDISKTIEKHAKSQGFSPARELVGHGVGFDLHEGPEILNYYDPRHPDQEIKEGLVLAIEPMLSEKSGSVVQYPDESFATKEGCLSAHFEHTVAILKSGPKILTRN